MILITLFKNYTPTFFTLRNFYKDIWDISNFVYFVGYENKIDKNFIYENYILNCGEIKKHININNFNYEYFNNIEIIELDNDLFILYNSIPNLKNTCNNFNKIKDNLYFIYNKLYWNNNNRYLCVDDDEFLFSTNIKQIKLQKLHRFHFVEIIPKDNYKEMEFCFQSWYSKEIERKKAKKNVYNCNGCKLFFFYQSNGLSRTNVWIHSQNKLYNNSACEYFQNNIIPNNYHNDKYIKNLLDKGICYHLTGLSLKNVYFVKTKNRFINKNYSEGNYTNYIKDNNTIKQFYETFIDNFLLKYIDQRDIELLKE